MGIHKSFLNPQSSALITSSALVKSEVPIVRTLKHLYRGYATLLSYGGNGLGVVKTIAAQQTEGRRIEEWKGTLAPRISHLHLAPPPRMRLFVSRHSRIS